MKILVSGACLCAVTSHTAHAQQVIAKGLWSLVAPSADGPQTLGVFRTSTDCVQAGQKGTADSVQKTADLQQKVMHWPIFQGPNDPDYNSPPSTDDRNRNLTEQQANAEYALSELYQAANCVQN